MQNRIKNWNWRESELQVHGKWTKTTKFKIESLEFLFSKIKKKKLNKLQIQLMLILTFKIQHPKFY